MNLVIGALNYFTELWWLGNGFTVVTLLAFAYNKFYKKFILKQSLNATDA